MASLRVAIDSRAAKTGRDEYLKYTGDLTKANREWTKDFDKTTKALVDGFEKSGVASKKITPNILAVVEAAINLRTSSADAKVTVEQLGRAFEAYKKIEQFNKDLSQAENIVLGFDKSAGSTIETIDRLGNSFEAMDLRARAARGAYLNLIDAQKDAERKLREGKADSLGKRLELEFRAARLAYNEFVRDVQDSPITLFPTKFGAGIDQIKQATTLSKGFFEEFGAGVPKIDKTIERIKELNSQIKNVSPAFGAGIGAALNGGGGRGATAPFGAGVNSPNPTPRASAGPVFATAFSDDLLRRQTEFARNAKIATQEIDRLGAASSATRSQVSQLFLGFSAVFAVREGVRNVVGDIRSYEVAMAATRAVTQATDEEFKRLSETARSFGVNSVFGATKAAESLRALGKAGLSAQESLDTLPTVLDFATVAGTNLDQSSELLSKTLRQFQLDTTKAAVAADALSIASNKTTTEVLPLTEALVNVGPIAADLGNSLQETTALLGTLAERGIQGGTAGTKLRGVLLSLVSPTDHAKEAIQELRDTTTGARIAVDDLDPSLHSAQQIFERLATSTLSAGSAEVIFQRRFASAALVLASGAKTTEKIIQANEELRGETKRVADEINNTLNGSIQRFSAAVEEAALSAGDAGLTGSLRDLVDFGREVALSLAGTNRQTEELSGSAKFAATAIKGIAIAGGVLVSIKIASYLAESRLGWIAYTKSIENARIAMASFQGTARIAPVLTAIGPAAFTAVAGITAIVAALQAYKKEIPEITEENKNLIAAYKAVQEATKKEREAATVKNYAKQVSAIQDVIQSTKDLIDAQKLADPSTRKDFRSFEKIIDFAGIKEDYDKVAALFKTPLKQNVLVDVVNSPQSVGLLEKALTKLNESLLVAKTNAKNFLAGDFGEEFERAETSLEKYLESLELEGKIAKETAGLESNAARDRAEIIRATYKITTKAIGAEKDAISELLARYTPLIAAAQKIRTEQEALAKTFREQAEATKLFSREFKELTDKVGLLKFSTEKRKEEAEVIRFANIAREAGRDLTKDEIKVIRESVRALNEDTAARKEAKKANSELERNLKSVAKQVATEIKQRLATVQSAKDMVEQYKAIALSIDDSVEAQNKASVLARFDIKTRGVQTQAIRDAREELESYLDTIAKGDNTAATRRVAELVEKYELQAAALNLTEDAQRSATAEQELANTVRGHTIDGLEEYDKRLKAAVNTLNEGTQKGRDASARGILVGLEQELELLKLTNEEREKQATLYQLDRVLAAGKIEDEDTLRKKIEATVEAVQASRKAREITDTLASGFEDAFEAALQNAKNFGDAATSIAREVSLEITRILLLRPLANSLANIFSGVAGAAAGVGGGGAVASANGNAFSGGNVIPFAKGGILSRPTYFPLNGGKTGLAGEAGPEAVMKLKRNNRGELGVIVAGGTGQQQPQNVVMHNNYYITTPDANSFRKSQRQITQDAKRFVR